MTGLTFILKGFIIGIIVSIPIGPIMLLTVQKAVNNGRKPAFACGLGATVVDTTCAIISAFALSAISSFIETHTSLIEIIGGLFIAGVGVTMLFVKLEERLESRATSWSTKNLVKAATMGFCNPAALAVMLAMFATFKMDMSGMCIIVPILAILALSAGSAGYWYLVASVVAHYGKRFNMRILLIINRIAGIGVILFGLWLILKGLNLL